MAKDRLSGKLAVILHADVAGSTELVRLNEQVTHERIQDTFHRFSGIITKYRGRVCELRGDALLAEFVSASDAVSAALAFQADQGDFNSQFNDGIQPTVRVGIAMGEVIIADDTVTGEGVVLAQRLEQLASGDGVVLQSTCQETIPGRYPFDYVDLGEHEVKGFNKPVRAYSACLKKGADLPPPKSADHRVPRARVAFAVIAVVAIGVSLAWFKPWEPRVEPASLERMALPLPKRPSIAVLPFENLSHEATQEHFVDGFTENIITELSRFSDLFIIARNTSFTYKNKAIKIQEIAEELGVQFVLEGSVQRSGNKIRVTAQLVDALSGHHLWAERYDRELKRVFDLQDELARSIVASLPGQVADSVLSRAKIKETNSLQAYDYFLLASDHGRRYTKKDTEKWRELLHKAIELDPEYARAYVGIAWSHFNDWWLGWSDDKEKSASLAFEMAKKAVELDSDLAEAHWVLASVYMNVKKQHDTALAEYEHALRLNPNNADIIAMRGWDLPQVGQADEGVREIKRALRLNPNNPIWYEYALVYALYNAQQYDEVITVAKLIDNPIMSTYAVLAGSYAQLGKSVEASEIVTKALTLQPEFSLSEWTETHNFTHPEDLERYLVGLRKAGFPENPPLVLPDKPSIAVLAFDNFSGDPDQEYLSDGITESLITRLAMLPDIFVIARNSSFTYKGKAVKVQQVGRELGVRYVLEGSVQKAGKRIRISAQLIEASTGEHLWAGSYDRELQDLFAVQDEITQQVATEMAVKLTVGESARLDFQATNNVQAYDYWLRGTESYRHFRKESNIKAGELFEKAIELDPQYARAIGWLGWVRLNESRFWWVEGREESFKRAEELALQAIAIDENSTIGHNLLSRIYSHKGLYEEAIAEGRRTIAIEPSHSNAYASLAQTMLLAGMSEDGQEYINIALRLSPYPPLWYRGIETNLNYLTGRYEAAIASGTKFLARSKEGGLAYTTWLMVIASYIELGREEDARAEAESFLVLNSDFSIEDEAEWRKEYAYKDKSWIDPYLENLRQAGLPE